MKMLVALLWLSILGLSWPSPQKAKDRITQQSAVRMLIEDAAKSFGDGHYAKALLDYERLRSRIGTSPDLEHNLRLCRRRLALDNSDEEWGLINALLKMGTRSLLTLAFILVSLGLLLILPSRKRLSEPDRPRSLQVFAIGSLGLGLLASLRCLQIEFQPRVRQAIVLSARAKLRQAPDDASPVLFTLPAGTGLQIQAASDRWAMVQHARGQAWLRRRNLGIVD